MNNAYEQQHQQQQQHHHRHRPSGVAFPHIIKEKLGSLIPKVKPAQAWQCTISGSTNNNENSIESKASNGIQHDKQEGSDVITNSCNDNSIKKDNDSASIPITITRTTLKPVEKTIKHDNSKKPVSLTSKEIEEKIKKISITLSSIQKSLYIGEESYYDDSLSYGNIYKGWEYNTFIDYKLVLSNNNSSNTTDNTNNSSTVNNVLSSISNNTRVVRSGRTSTMPDDDRWFTNSCHVSRYYNRTSSSSSSSSINDNATSASSLVPLLSSSSSKIISSINPSIITSSSLSLSTSNIAINNKTVMAAPQSSKHKNGTTNLIPITSTTSTSLSINNKEQSNRNGISYSIPRKSTQLELNKHQPALPQSSSPTTTKICSLQTNNTQLVTTTSTSNDNTNSTNNISSSSSGRRKKISLDSSSSNKRSTSNKLSSLDTSSSNKRNSSGCLTEQQSSSASDARKKRIKKRKCDA